MIREDFLIYVILIFILLIILAIVWIVIEIKAKKRYHERLENLKKSAELRIIG